MAGPADPSHSRDAAPRTGLPSRLTSFIGRDEERLLLEQRLLDRTTRLLTLTGAGGVGKSRLALEAAEAVSDRFADGAHYVSLGPVPDPAQVGWTIAQALEIREVAGRRILRTIQEYLRERRLLLVLDNFEHLLPAAPDLADLLAACPGLKLLVTSRAPLRLDGEREFVVQPLALPARGQHFDLEALARVPSAALFLDRAGEARPDLALTDADATAIAEICHQLDGLPLAIELAAARVKLLLPSAMLLRLERRLPLLTGGPRDRPARHQTLRDAIAWSFDLLSRPQRDLFRRLAVFVGGFDLEAAEAVAGTLAADGRAVFDDVAGLVEQHLLQPVRPVGGEPRFQMLETIREFAQEQLQLSGEAARVRRLHADYFLALAEEADPNLLGPRQLEWLARLDADHANLVAALGWLAEQYEEPWARARLLQLAGSLGWFWWFSGRVGEGRQWLELALGRSALAGEAPARVRARALQAAGGLAMVQGEYDRASECFERAAELYQADWNATQVGRCLTYRAIQDLYRGLSVVALERLQRSVELAREIGDTWGLAMAGSNLATVVRSHDPAQADEILATYTPLARQVGDRYLLGSTLHKVGTVAVLLRQFDRAEALFREALSQFRDLRDGWWTGRCLQLLGLVAFETGRYRRAACLLGAAWARLQAVGGQLMPYHREWHERALAQSREAIGAAAFQSAWNQGLALSAEGAATCALEPLSDPEAGLESPPACCDLADDLVSSPSAEAAGATSVCARGGAADLLSPRECEVAALIAQGLSNREIAARLVIAERTAEAHVSHVLGKLGLRSRAQVAVWAVEAGLPGLRSA